MQEIRLLCCPKAKAANRTPTSRGTRIQTMPHKVNVYGELTEGKLVRISFHKYRLTANVITFFVYSVCVPVNIICRKSKQMIDVTTFTERVTRNANSLAMF